MSTSDIVAIDQAVAAAHEVSRQWAESGVSVRAGLLDALADALEDNQEDLIVLADQETHLGVQRLTGEVVRRFSFAVLPTRCVTASPIDV